MYCGDETGSFIGDIGSHTSRFGYGGDNAPSYVVHSRVVVGDKSNQPTKRFIPTSCYNSHRWYDSGNDNDNDNNSIELKSPLRQPNYSHSASKNPTTSSDTAVHPLTDPVQYLQQGDTINDWDAYEYMWLNALDTSYVKDTLKHTTGGRDPMSATIAASGVQSSRLTSTPIVEGDSKCVHPILVVSPGCTHTVNTRSDGGGGSHDNNGDTGTASTARSRKEMVQLTELMMETVGAGAMFVAPTPMLVAFSHGRQTCLAVDIGAGGTRVTPVVDGIVLQQSQRRSGRGGDWLSNCLWQALSSSSSSQSNNSSSIPLRPRYQVHKQGRAAASDGTACSFAPACRNPSFHRWAMHDLMYELRTSDYVNLPQWWYDPTIPFYNYITKTTNKDDDVAAASAQEDNMDIDETTDSTQYYELPDGTKIDLTTRIGKDICRLPELLFADDCPFQEFWSEEQKLSSSAILSQHATLSNAPLPKLIHSSLAAVADVDVRKDLAASVLLTGGVSVIKNLESRLSLELPRITSAAYKPKVLASRYHVERQSAAWIGGSILTSLGSFQQLWLSKTEYEEYGASLAIQRFP